MDDPHTLEAELRAALELMRPGFMTLSVMRHGERIVDFVWSFVSTAAGRILGRNALDLYGKCLRAELAGQDGCAALFEQYRRVVVQGTASATQVHHHIGHSESRPSRCIWAPVNRSREPGHTNAFPWNEPRRRN